MPKKINRAVKSTAANAANSGVTAELDLMAKELIKSASSFGKRFINAFCKENGLMGNGNRSKRVWPVTYERIEKGLDIKLEKTTSAGGKFLRRLFIDNPSFKQIFINQGLSSAINYPHRASSPKVPCSLDSHVDDVLKVFHKNLLEHPKDYKSYCNRFLSPGLRLKISVKVKSGLQLKRVKEVTKGMQAAGKRVRKASGGARNVIRRSRAVAPGEKTFVEEAAELGSKIGRKAWRVVRKWLFR